MPYDTGIAWTEATWNPWQGCSKIWPGLCPLLHVYREAPLRPGSGAGGRSKTTFTAPLHWETPRRIITCSWSDWFIAKAEFAGARRPGTSSGRRRSITYQILTKRGERIAAHLPPDWGAGWPHVWLGVSVENQRWLTRLGTLLQIPAAVHFASCEPLLGPLDLTPWFGGGWQDCLG